MASSSDNRIIVDSIHNDIHLTDLEWRVIDTPSFQRLRNVKQLQLSHLTYPNATHTRFSHSIGTLAIMKRVLDQKSSELELDEPTKENLKLAALLHDIGHYPYSHLVERMWKTTLTEEYLEPKTEIDVEEFGYPKHEETGRIVLQCQNDILTAIGSKKRAIKVADIFTGSDTELSSFVTSSLDLDRMDYLLRDSYATGVPYGKVDMNYLLNNIEISKFDGEKIVCFSEKAIPAAEQFLMARFSMHRTVYFHKTTCGMEEACSHLLKRLYLKGGYEMHGADKIKDIFRTEKLFDFTDAYIDRIIQQAVKHEGDDEADKLIRILANSIVYRRPPKLLKEVAFWSDRSDNHDGKALRRNFRDKIAQLSTQYGIIPGQFMLSEKTHNVEKEESRRTPRENKQADERNDEKVYREIVKIFKGSGNPPESLMDRKDCFISKFSGQQFILSRIYLAIDINEDLTKIEKIKNEMNNWHIV
ncbi:MAG: HD domain-containing protein [Anaerohalosphaeraceae bacterium]|nr:HD domain-containing protein [Anaerohalosphaeraceae bacterium]